MLAPLQDSTAGNRAEFNCRRNTTRVELAIGQERHWRAEAKFRLPVLLKYVEDSRMRSPQFLNAPQDRSFGLNRAQDARKAVGPSATRWCWEASNV